MKHNEQLTSLLEGWEEVYKKGQLTLWVLLAVRDVPRHMREIKEFIATATHNTFSVDDNSMYRALKRYEKARLLTFALAPGDGGPVRKVYRLTDLGLALLNQFVERNITQVYYDKNVKALMNGGKNVKRN